MAVAYISEYGSPNLSTGLPIEPINTDQTVAIGAGSVQSATFKANTYMVRISADAVCSILFGTNPTATATNKRIAANAPGEYFYVNPGQKVAVITNT